MPHAASHLPLSSDNEEMDETGGDFGPAGRQNRLILKGGSPPGAAKPQIREDDARRSVRKFRDGNHRKPREGKPSRDVRKFSRGGKGRIIKMGGKPERRRRPWGHIKGLDPA